MAKSKKFGTFGGVFTPSILTILGVIMYLRFPTIIGQAGLINTIGIIVIAHIISITTSLSVASLSTDKPVQTGGTYFMISRSLGLPIGGTLGLALFVGLSFSVSLYLIGFAESFLQYWGFENSINTIRITGTIVLVAVTTITFISTSLAIKSQYFIMVAIGLSLLSIFFGQHNFAPTELHLKPLADAAPFMLLFGIFFPAVTGFEAGVSMSGDLKDPKKSLPTGAILAVGIGFIVYIGLAIFYSFTVDAEALRNDPEILFKISLVPALVIAGIWGATLSSALGSILGAPRILQAIAMDKIAPKFFAIGTGKTSEPRNALLLAFVIAEVGILIGELDVIARIVSMFFITTYGFLNLASAIESWSSSDFRPAFKIPRFVSILGALSAFVVMILLDFIALVGATIVLGLLYFYLQRKELILESGDAWGSFWTNLAKRALLKLSIEKDHKRNWRPNIVLFSGGEKARPHLVELGLSLTGKLGALTDFELSTATRRKSEIEVPPEIGTKKQKPDYFIRQLQCDSVPEGIKTVTNIYGFSGFEPNTVLLGWSKTTGESNFLSEVILHLKTKNLNAIFLDYDKDNGFGKKERIDIWWSGKGPHLNFSLNILRFLQSDPSWRDALVRIMIIISDSALEDSLYRNTNAILLDRRMQAEVKVINNDFGSRTTEEIIQTESAKSDLLLLGLSQKNTSHTIDYIEKINVLCKLPASILLLSPSAEFEGINLIDRYVAESTIANTTNVAELIELPNVDGKLLKTRIDKLDHDLMKTGAEFCNQTVKRAGHQLLSFSSSLHDSSSHIFNALQKEYMLSEKHKYQSVVNRNQITYLNAVLEIIHDETKNNIKETEDILQKGIPHLVMQLGNFVYELPDTIDVPFLIPPKSVERVFSFPLKKYVTFCIESKMKPLLAAQFAVFEETSKQMSAELRNLIFEFNDRVDKLEIEKLTFTDDIISDFNEVLSRFSVLENELEFREAAIVMAILNGFREISVGLVDDLQSPSRLKSARNRIKNKLKKDDETLGEFAESWGVGMRLLNNTFYLDVLVLSKKIVFRNIIQKANSRMSAAVTEMLFVKQNELLKNLNNIIQNDRAQIEPVLFPDSINLKTPLSDSYEKAVLLMNNLPEELFLPEKIYNDSALIPFNDYNQVTVSFAKSAYYDFDFFFYDPFSREVENLEAAVKKAVVESKEANSMLLFYRNNIQNANVDDYSIEKDGSLFNKLLKRVENEKAMVESSLGRLRYYSDSYISEAFSKLFYHSLIDSGKHIYEADRAKKGKRYLHMLTGLIEKAKKQYSNSLVFLLNSTSSGIILSKKFLDEEKHHGIHTKEILDLVDALLPKRKVYTSLPGFYRNLLSSSSQIIDEFWIPRPKEMDAIKEALTRHRKGLGGAVVITGVHGAGKATLTHYAVGHLFKPHNIIRIASPAAGSTNPDDLFNAFKKQLGEFDDFSEMFNSLPYESVVVINNIELWWERRPGGGDAMETLVDLIKIYSHKVFFIITANSMAYNLMKQIYPIDDYSLATIACSPFDSQELQQMILHRHKSSGINFSYNGTAEDSVSQLGMAVLFNRYFTLSKGIPGVAINLWKANIININNDEIEIRKPAKIDKSILYELPAERLLVLTIFILHKNIDADKLGRITGMSIDKSADLLTAIANSGLIVKQSNQVYTLERYVEPLIVEVCDHKGLI